MRKYRSVAHVRLLGGSTVYTLSFWLITSFLVYWSNTLWGILYYWLSLGIPFAVMAHLCTPIGLAAYTAFEMSEDGVRNRKLSLDWQSVDRVELYPVVLKLKNLKIPFASMICLSNAASRTSAEYDASECVYFAATRKNLRMLEAYAGDRSAAVKDFLTKYTATSKKDENQ